MFDHGVEIGSPLDAQMLYPKVRLRRRGDAQYIDATSERRIGGRYGARIHAFLKDPRVLSMGIATATMLGVIFSGKRRQF